MDENMNMNENAATNENVSQDKVDTVEFNNLKKEINTLKGKLTTLENKKKDLEEASRDLIAKTVCKRKEDLEKSYDEVLREAEVRLKAVEKEKESERKKNLDKIIEKNTRSVRENNTYLKNEIKRVIKDNKLPFFVNTSFYMTIWNPTKISEVLCGFFAMIIVLLIPTILSFVVYKDKLLEFFKNDILRYIAIAFIYLIVIFVFGGIWLMIEKITKKKPEAIKEIVELRRNISDNDKEIARITKETSRNMVEDNYDYTKLDREIEAGKLEVENYKTKRKEALDNFINVTQDEITKSIELEASKEINIVNADIENVKAELSSMQTKYDEMKLKIAEG
ncbi:MAG: hypothetical protein J6O09_02445 [Lachnospiraceae bacterium]|nr:hypothetical protein [Lachnospiraceae bacterium]